MAQKRKHILLSEVEGQPAVCFDTGLEPRSFARTKMSQSLIEKGYIVNQDGTNEVWVSTGVCVFDDRMRVWGKAFKGKRFDLILNEAGNKEAEKANQTALQSIICWMKAKMYLGDTYSTFNSSATFIGSNGSVLFTPPNLANRCLYVEGIDTDYFNCPDLLGMDAVAFCAGAMLYKILSGTLPFTERETLYQDMREGIFMPVHLAVPGLNKKIAELIQSALLLPVEKKNRAYNKKAMDIIQELLTLLTEKGISAVPISSLINNNQTPEEIKKIESGKKAYLLKRKAVVSTSRFAVKHKYPLIGVAGVLTFVLIIIFSTVSTVRNRPSTAGLLPESIISAYFNAFSNLDHVFMEACVQGSDSTIKADINAAAGYFAIERTREVYGPTRNMPIISARAWLEAGNELPAENVFGVTDLTIELIAGSINEDMVIYRAEYNLWAPNEHARNRMDRITVRRDRRGNWRMTEILRTER